MPLKRREVLETLGVGSALVIAGCSGSNPTETSSRGPTSTEAGPTTVAESSTSTGGDWPYVGNTPRNHTYESQSSGPGTRASARELWKLSVPENAKVVEVNYSPPVSDGKTVFVGVSGYTVSEETRYVNDLVAIDAATGKRKWSYEYRPDATSYGGGIAPTVAGGTVLLPGDGIHVVDAETGERRRIIETDKPFPGGGMVVSDGDVFATTNLYDKAVRTFSLSEGTKRWSALSRVSKLSSVAVTRDTVYAPAATDVVALDRSDGTERWRTEAGFESTVYDPGNPGPIHTPVVDDQRVYVATGVEGGVIGDNGGVVALNRTDGSIEWRFTPDAETEVSGVYGLPVLHDGVLYVVGGRGSAANGFSSFELFAIDATDGTLNWKQDAPGLSFYPVGANETVYVPFEDTLVAYDMASGDRTEVATSATPLQISRGNALVGDSLVSSARESGGVVSFDPVE